MATRRIIVADDDPDFGPPPAQDMNFASAAPVSAHKKRIIAVDDDADFGPPLRAFAEQAAPAAQMAQPVPASPAELEMPASAREAIRRIMPDAFKGARRIAESPAIPVAATLASIPLTAGLGALPVGASALARIGFAAKAAGLTGLMAGGGEATRQLASRAVGGEAPETMGEAAGDIATTGALNALTEGGVRGASGLVAGGRSIAPSIMKALPAIPEKYGKAVAETPAILRRAFPRKTMSESYEAFERYTGLKGLGKVMEDEAKIFSPGELIDKTLSAAKKLKAGETLAPQELYEASQAVNHLKLSAKFGEPTAASALESGILQRAKGPIDSALEKLYPEYKVLRKQNFESKAAEAFQSLLPQNKNLSPNAPRTWGAISAAAGSTLAGSPLAAVGSLAAVSPKAWGAGITAADLTGKLVGPAAKGLPAAVTALLQKIREGKKKGSSGGELP